ncbi:MAG TPA: site-specific integrase [Gammaproteobacteria bacterium]
MGRNRKTSGLHKRGDIWHIDKLYRGVRIRESCGTSSLAEAEEVLAHRLEAIRLQRFFGIRPQKTFEEAATKYLDENLHKRTIAGDATSLRQLMPFIGHLPLEDVHDDTLRPFIQHRLDQGIKKKSINNALSVVRRILNLAARRWREDGKTLLQTAPLITMLKVDDARKPYPLSWDEQKLLLSHLPDYLAAMALFKVNTGTREQEVCQLQWDWEVPVPELDTSVFLIPEGLVKNEEERVVVLNRVAKSVVDAQRGKHDTHVFVSTQNAPVRSINNNPWQHSRVHAALAAIKNDPRHIHTEHAVKRLSLFKVEVVIRCERTHASKPYVLTYTIDDYNTYRVQKGMKPLSAHQKADPNIRMRLFYRAIERFIGECWPEYEAFSKVRVHDLKHTFGRRLRSARVSLETRKVLLGHKNGDITTHYSAAELEELIEAANRVCESNSHKTPTLTLLKRKTG